MISLKSLCEPPSEPIPGILNRWFLAWIPFWLYSFLIFQAAVLPPEKLPAILHRFDDKFFHFTEYACLFFLTLNAFEKTKWNGWRRSSLGLAVLYGLFWGLVTELAQRSVPGRSAEFKDWLADTAGILAGLAIHLFLAGLAGPRHRVMKKEETSWGGS